MTMRATLVLAFLPTGLLAAGPQHFTLSSAYNPPAKAGGNGSIAVVFVATDPEVHINEAPAPRLKLDPAQTVLVDKQAPGSDKVEPFDPDNARYLDLTLPVLFPVKIAKDAPKGTHGVTASVTYFYCSKRAGWCRKGTTDVSVSVNVP
jgi:hypothetical protein